MLTNKIEIPSVQLLDENRSVVEDLRSLAGSLGLDFGWHYLLDLTWILRNLEPQIGMFIMDAGAGTGILQWYLATQGVEVLSVDRGSREYLPLRFRKKFNVVGLREADPTSNLSTGQGTPDLQPPANLLKAYLRQPKKALALGSEYIKNIGVERAPGRVIIYNQDLNNLHEVLDNSIDAIVAVSALEHNKPEDLSRVVTELMRVLKPGGALLATLCAGRDADWYHEPSAGWCYTDTSLQRIFDLPDETPSNYSDYDVLFAALHDCAELRDNLAHFYFHSGENGMPWGRWDPQYQPVGVCKIKAFNKNKE